MPPEENPAARKARRSYRSWLWVGVGLLGAGAIAIPFFMLSQRNAATLAAQESPAPVGDPSIGCLGRIEPEGGVIHVSAPYFAGRPSLVAELPVKEGDWVQPGQTLAILDSRRQLEAARTQAEARVALARRRLEQVKEGAKPADRAALEAEIARWEATVAAAEAESTRYEQLHQTHDVSSSERDEKRLAVESARRNLEQARRRLESLSEVRKTDVATAEGEVNAAVADRNHAGVQLESAVVRAPRQGRILKIHAKPGEEVGAAGVLELGDTSRMVVMAEVYETDIARVRLGQRATISSDILGDKFEGTVTEIGSQVTKNSVLPTDPVAFSDARIVKVKIAVPSGNALSSLIYGKVDVVIHP